MFSSTASDKHSHPEFTVINRYSSQTDEERRNNLQSIVTQYLSHRLSQPGSAEDDPAL